TEGVHRGARLDPEPAARSRQRAGNQPAQAPGEASGAPHADRRLRADANGELEPLVDSAVVSVVASVVVSVVDSVVDELAATSAGLDAGQRAVQRVGVPHRIPSRNSW